MQIGFFLQLRSQKRARKQCQSVISLPSFFFFVVAYTVSGQYTIGREFTPMALIQPTDDRQNAVYSTWLLKLQPAVMLQNWQKSSFHQIECD